MVLGKFDSIEGSEGSPPEEMDCASCVLDRLVEAALYCSDIAESNRGTRNKNNNRYVKMVADYMHSYAFRYNEKTPCTWYVNEEGNGLEVRWVDYDLFDNGDRPIEVLFISNYHRDEVYFIFDSKRLESDRGSKSIIVSLSSVNNTRTWELILTVRHFTEDGYRDNRFKGSIKGAWESALGKQFSAL